jgi:hypothetical protein
LASQAQKDISRETSVMLNGVIFPLGTGTLLLQFLVALSDAIAMSLLELCDPAVLKQCQESLLRRWLCVITTGAERVDFAAFGFSSLLLDTHAAGDRAVVHARTAATTTAGSTSGSLSRKPSRLRQEALPTGDAAAAAVATLASEQSRPRPAQRALSSRDVSRDAVDAGAAASDAAAASRPVGKQRRKTWAVGESGGVGIRVAVPVCIDGGDGDAAAQPRPQALLPRKSLRDLLRTSGADVVCAGEWLASHNACPCVRSHCQLKKLPRGRFRCHAVAADVLVSSSRTVMGGDSYAQVRLECAVVALARGLQWSVGTAGAVQPALRLSVARVHRVGVWPHVADRDYHFSAVCSHLVCQHLPRVPY